MIIENLAKRRELLRLLLKEYPGNQLLAQLWRCLVLDEACFLKTQAGQLREKMLVEEKDDERTKTGRN